MPMVTPEKEYALYKGDELIGMGTAQELAEQFGVRVETIHYYNTPTYKKRTNPNRARRLVPLDEEDDLDDNYRWDIADGKIHLFDMMNGNSMCKRHQKDHFSKYDYDGIDDDYCKTCLMRQRKTNG